DGDVASYRWAVPDYDKLKDYLQEQSDGTFKKNSGRPVETKVRVTEVRIDPTATLYDPTPGLPGGPSDGDRFSALATANGWTIYNTYEWDADGGAWIEDLYASAESEKSFHVDYYNIVWMIQDMLTNKPLDGLHGGNSAGWGPDQDEDGKPDGFSKLASPVSMRVPHNDQQWQASWEKPGYSTVEPEFSASDHTEYLLMETTVIHLYRAESRFSYTPASLGLDKKLGGGDDVPDKLAITSWLERDGSVLSGGIFCDVRIFDRTTL
ncbi:unnamed protein product, partial [marine sediment metagenome]